MSDMKKRQTFVISITLDLAWDGDSCDSKCPDSKYLQIKGMALRCPFCKDFSVRVPPKDALAIEDREYLSDEDWVELSLHWTDDCPLSSLRGIRQHSPDCIESDDA